MKRLLITLIAVLLPVQAWSQATVLQGGTWSPGRAPAYSSSGGAQPIVQDSGPAGGNTTGQGLKELNITARGTGTAPYAGQGTGPNGEVFCIQDAVSTNAAGYHYLCLSANVSSSGLISFGSAGGASALPLTLKVNGADYQFPFTDGYVVGPASSTVNNVACWNNTTGTLLKDCGAFPGVAGTNGQIQYNNAGAFGGFTLGGDATVNTGTGALTITKIGNQNITLGGTLTTAGAFTTSGANALTLTTTTTTNVTFPATGSGTLATLAGSEAFTNKTYNGNTWTAGTGVLTIAAAKTLTASNTLTFAGTDGSTLNIGTGGTLGTAAYTASTAYVPSGTQITNSLSGDVPLNNPGVYQTGPTVAQGSTGTWFASGAVTVLDTAGAATLKCKLWDGTTVIASGVSVPQTANESQVVALSGYLATPASNIRISCTSASTATGVMKFDYSGAGKDSTVTAFRVQ